MPKISVIIPVYNAEKYLSQCLESLINQTFKDIEIICINDGSTDASLEILNKYAAQNDKIKVINQKNRGISSARNIGIERATGEYISFVDSDDFADERMYENLVKYLPQELICFEGQVYPFDSKNPLQKQIVNKKKGVQKVTDKVIQNTNIYLWNKLFKTSIIKDNNIKFPEGLIFEDFPFVWEYMLSIKNACYVNKKYYFYRQHNASAMKTCADKSIQHLYVWHYLYERLKQKNILYQHINTIKNLFEKYLILAYKLSNDDGKSLIIETGKQYAGEINYTNINSLINTLTSGKLIYSNKYETIFSIKNSKKSSIKYKTLTVLNKSIIISKQILKNKKPNVLVHMHIYYTEQLKYMLKKLKNINSCNWDLYVTLIKNDVNIINKIKDIKPDAKILIVENRGYDIWPFIQVLNSVNLNDYDFILKFHTKKYRKKKDYYGKGYSWRNYLINALLKNKKTFRQNLITMLENPEIGLIGSGVTLAKMGIKEDDDTILFEKLCKKYNLPVSKGNFIAGTMFLVRAKCYEAIKNMKLTAEDFPEEQKTSSRKSTAHTMERLLSRIIEMQNYKIYTVKSKRYTLKQLIKPALQFVFALNNCYNNGTKAKKITILGFKILIKGKNNDILPNIK